PRLGERGQGTRREGLCEGPGADQEVPGSLRQGEGQARLRRRQEGRRGREENFRRGQDRGRGLLRGGREGARRGPAVGQGRDLVHHRQGEGDDAERRRRVERQRALEGVS